MADEIETIILKPGSVMDISPTPTNELVIGTKESIMDFQGNVASTNANPNGTPKKEIYFKPSPIPRLAAAASLNKKIPTAGGFAIDRCKEPAVNFPPECMLYEDQPWVLGKMNPAALVDHDEPEPEPTDPEVEVIQPDVVIDEAKELSESPEVLMEDINKNIVTVPNPKKAVTRPKTPTRRSTSRPGTGKSPVPSPRGKQAIGDSKLTKSPAPDDTANKKVTSPRSGVKKTVTSKARPSLVDTKK